MREASTLTGLLLPLADRWLVLPNVAVAELIDGQALAERPAHAPGWLVGEIRWRELCLPLLCFEAACEGREATFGPRARIVVLNALGDGPLRYTAMLIQGLPRSCRLDAQLSYVDVPLAALELAAVQVGEHVARVPDLPALERLVASEYG